MKRVFLAVNIPEKIKKEIELIFAQKLQEKKLRIVKKENMHITMHFFGDIEEKALAEMIKKLKEIKFGKFKAEISGAGNFSDRVIWIGIEKGKKELGELNKIVLKAIREKKGRFHPHITLARNKALKKSEVKELVGELNKKEFNAEFEAVSLDLIESVLTPKGAKYSVLEKISFV